MRSKAPEHVRCDGEIAFGRPLVRLAADAGIDPENLLDDDNRRFGLALRARQPGVEATLVVERSKRDPLTHVSSLFAAAWTALPPCFTSANRGTSNREKGSR